LWWIKIKKIFCKIFKIQRNFHAEQKIACNQLAWNIESEKIDWQSQIFTRKINNRIFCNKILFTCFLNDFFYFHLSFTVTCHTHQYSNVAKHFFSVFTASFHYHTLVVLLIDNYFLVLSKQFESNRTQTHYISIFGVFRDEFACLLENSFFSTFLSWMNG
jgi:hypothetical protein